VTRTFIAADLDEDFLDGAAAIGISLGSVGRLVKRETMHCTITFFGEVDDVRLEELKALVEGLPNAPIAVKATRLDAFGTPRKAHVIVLPLEDDGSLARVHETIGLKENRPYRPHLTLARLKKPEDVQALVASTPVSLEGRVIGLTLYKSVLGKNGPTYTPLARALG
jgi:RNA 2',3'-cyclic 3'-phosphodiesterase